ncbi:MAG: HD domain-containing protein [Ornithinimicrobium sp.]
MWSTERAPELAAEHLQELGDRWRHVQTVGTLAESLVDACFLPEDVWCAAWLHDIGYSFTAHVTGLHSLDGAHYLSDLGAPCEVVALVGWHTGAAFEAEERGLRGVLAQLPEPDPTKLDALTLLDLVSAPDGTVTTPQERIDEILERYGPGEAVHKAVSRSGRALLTSADRARTSFGLSDMWPIGVLDSVREAQAH